MTNKLSEFERGRNAGLQEAVNILEMFARDCEGDLFISPREQREHAAQYRHLASVIRYRIDPVNPEDAWQEG